MSAFTINSGGTTDWDSLSGGSTNATLDTYTISNGSTLRINTDSYQCANHSAAFGSLDTVAYSGLGGTLLIDPTAVRVVPYNTGTGNVPAIGTSLSQGGVSGALLGVWSDWQAEPTASGSAMPSSGYIKLRSVSGGAFAAGAITGIGANATGADVQGWIEVRGADTATITVSRVGKFQVAGAWFDLGTTSGSRGQVLPCPTTATVAGVFPGVWIETSSGSGVYERYAGVGSMPANASTATDERGKIVWQTTSGIRIGSDGTNNVGYLPPSGCNVRIPAAILTCCTRSSGSGSGPRVLPNATLATRQEFVTTSAGDIDIDGAVLQWYGNWLQAYRSKIHNSAINDTLIQQENATAVDIDNVIVSPTQAQVNFALNMLSCFYGGTVQNSLFVRYSLASSGFYVNVVNYCSEVLFDNVRSISLVFRANASTGVWSATSNNRLEWRDCYDIGGLLAVYSSADCSVKDLTYADRLDGQTSSSLGATAVSFSSFSSNCMLDGLSFGGLTNVHPYTSCSSVGNGSNNCTVRNIGTYASPLYLGSANACGYLLSTGSNSRNLRIQRCHASNTRSAFASVQNSDVGVQIQNCSGDYADTFTYASLNSICRAFKSTSSTSGAVAVYGTHWLDGFSSTSAGYVDVRCNEPTAASAAQCASTGGAPRYNSSGQVLLTAIGDQVTWEMPYFALGHTAAANVAPAYVGTNTGNLTYEFQYDLGSGYNGSWLTLNQTNWNAVGAITPSVGIRLKIRATCATANAGNLLTNIRLTTDTTDTAQSTNLYPLDSVTLTLTGLVSGSDIVILAAGTETVRVQVDAHGSTSYGYVYETTESIDIAVYKAGQIPFFVRNYPLSSGNANLPVAQVADPSYLE